MIEIKPFLCPLIKEACLRNKCMLYNIDKEVCNLSFLGSICKVMVRENQRKELNDN